MEKLNTRMTRAELQDRVDGLRNQLNLSEENSSLRDRLASVQPMVDAQPVTAPLAVENNKKGSRHDRSSLVVGGALSALIGFGTAAAIATAFALPGGGRIGGGLSESPTATPSISEAAGRGNPNASASASFEVSASASTEASASTQPSLSKPASQNASGEWIVTNPDGVTETIKVVDGFTPDTKLVLAPEYGKTLPIEPTKFADFQKSLNDPKNPLAGYTYGENDQSDNLNYKRTLQAPMYSWTVLTGLEVEVPGIGKLTGGKGMAVEVVIMNITDHVKAYGSDNPVFIKDGFTGTGRIWDGNKLPQTEQGVASHYVNRLQTGVTGAGESGFIGQCDQVGNCDKVLVVTVVERQWGQNQDGTPRYQMQLLREQIVTK